MNKKVIFLSVLMAIGFSGCGASGGCDNSSTSNVDTQDNNETIVLSKEVAVQRGPVFFSTVTDSVGKTAVFDGFSSDGLVAKYSFEATPTPPLKASGGYVDANFDGAIDINDYELDVNLTSSSSIISPLTTMVSDTNETKQLQNVNLLKNKYGLTVGDIFNTLPSDSSKDYVNLLNNTSFVSLKNNHELNSTQFETTFDDFNTTLSNNPAWTKEEKLKQLEQKSFDDIGAIALDNTKVSTFNTKFNNRLKIVDISSDLNKTVSSSDALEDIWDIAFAIPNEDVSGFDIGVKILKNSSQSLGHIIYEGLTISNGEISMPNKITVFGKKASGSTGTKSYISTNQSHQDVLKGSVGLFSNYLRINLAHIMNNQDIVSSSSFKGVSSYDVSFYIEKIDINVTKVSDLKLQSGIGMDGSDIVPKYHNFENNTAVYEGTINIQ